MLCYLEVYLYQCLMGLVPVITQDLTQKMHHSGAFSVLILCYLEIYLYQCPVGLALVITQDYKGLILGLRKGEGKGNTVVSHALLPLQGKGLADHACGLADHAVRPHKMFE